MSTRFPECDFCVHDDEKRESAECAVNLFRLACNEFLQHTIFSKCAVYVQCENYEPKLDRYCPYCGEKLVSE